MTAYVPEPGQHVRIRRFLQPTLAKDDPERELIIQVTGVVDRVRGSVVILEKGSLAVQVDTRSYEGESRPQELMAASLGCTFLGGESGRYLVTEVVPTGALDTQGGELWKAKTLRNAALAAVELVRRELAGAEQAYTAAEARVRVEQTAAPKADKAQRH